MDERSKINHIIQYYRQFDSRVIAAVMEHLEEFLNACARDPAIPSAAYAGPLKFLLEDLQALLERQED
ncbi:MAG: hypothetical protein ACYTGV_10085 [Planctomycetota bacterium]|jgi:hypothetical protein